MGSRASGPAGASQGPSALSPSGSHTAKGCALGSPWGCFMFAENAQATNRKRAAGPRWLQPPLLRRPGETAGAGRPQRSGKGRWASRAGLQMEVGTLSRFSGGAQTLAGVFADPLFFLLLTVEGTPAKVTLLVAVEGAVCTSDTPTSTSRPRAQPWLRRASGETAH